MKNANILMFCALILYCSCGKKIEETKPIRKDVTETVFASGYLEADDTYLLTALSDGYLEEVNFNEGDLIKKGDVLAIIDNKANQYDFESANKLYVIAQQNTSPNAPLLLQAKNNVEVAKQKMRQDELQEQRYNNLLQSNSISKVEYENTLLEYQTSKANYDSALEAYKKAKQDAKQAEISNRALKDINQVNLLNNKITAVVPGKVYEKFKEQGDYVKKGDQIATIGDTQEIHAKVNIDETNIGKIKVGQKAYIQLNTNKSKTYEGIVSEILPSFDDDTQSFICKIFFKEVLDFKIVKTQLQANIVVGFQKNALVIPRRFIDFGGYVQIKGQDSKTKVETNFVSDEWVQVVSGIDENTILITDNLSENKTETSEVGAQMRR